MSQLPVYDPQDFAAMEFSADVLSALNIEHADIKAVLDVARSNLSALQRDDLKLANGAVHKDSLAADTLTLFAAAWNPRGPWATATLYATRDTVTHNGNTWLCVSPHTAGTFATDQGNGLWMALTQTDTDAELLAVTTSGTASAYTVTSGSAYASWANVPPLLVDWHTASADNATFAVDGLAAKNLTVEGANVNANELTGKDIVVYDSAADTAVIVGRDRSSTVKPQIAAAITGDSTLTDSQLVGVSHLVQPVDISSGSGSTVTFTLSAPSAANKGKFVTVRVSADGGPGTSNRMRVNNNAATTLFTGYVEGDHVTLVSDGSSAWLVIDRSGVALDRNLDATASTELLVNRRTTYDLANGAGSFTLPDLSVIAEGDEVALHLVGSAVAKVELSKHANDGGGVFWIGTEAADHIVAVKQGSAWVVLQHYESIYLRLSVAADEAIAQGASEKIELVADEDPAGLWDAANDKLDVPATIAAFLSFSWKVLGSSNRAILPEAKLGGAYLHSAADTATTDGGAGPSGFSLTMLDIKAAAGDAFELWALNVDNNGGNMTLMGDAAGDESLATIRLRWRWT